MNLIQGSLHEFNSEISKLRSELAVVKTNNTNQIKSLGDLTTKLNTIEDDQRATSQTMQLLDTELECSSTHVAFSVAKTFDSESYVGPVLAIPPDHTVVAKSIVSEHPIEWDVIHLNEGGGFNSSSGEFVCTVPGVYSFQLHLMLDTETSCVVLQKNGAVDQDTRLLYMRKNDPNMLFGSFGSQVMSLAEGDAVSVSAIDGCLNELFTGETGSDDNLRNSLNYFSGHLLYRTDC